VQQQHADSLENQEEDKRYLNEEGEKGKVFESYVEREH